MMNSPRAGSLNAPRPGFDSAAAAAMSAWAATPRAAAPLRNARLLILAFMVDLREEGITLQKLYRAGGQINGVVSRLLRRETRKSLRSTVITLCRGVNSLR